MVCGLNQITVGCVQRALVHLATILAVRWPPTFPGVLGVLCNSFLQLLCVVHDSFQRYTFIIFICCDVN